MLAPPANSSLNFTLSLCPLESVPELVRLPGRVRGRLY